LIQAGALSCSADAASKTSAAPARSPAAWRLLPAPIASVRLPGQRASAAS